MLQEGAFRHDLYFRISTFVLRIPPLRDRREDIPLLARHLLSRYASDMGRSDLHLLPEAIQALESHTWPGNIRELRNVIERAVLLSNHSALGVRDLHFDSIPRGAAEEPLNLSLADVERRHIERVLAAEGGNVARAAQQLGIPRSSLYQKIKRLGLIASRF
jgi:DNA-binding NtrC family response regulator